MNEKKMTTKTINIDDDDRHNAEVINFECNIPHTHIYYLSICEIEYI